MSAELICLARSEYLYVYKALLFMSPLSISGNKKDDIGMLSPLCLHGTKFPKSDIRSQLPWAYSISDLKRYMWPADNKLLDKMTTKRHLDNSLLSNVVAWYQIKQWKFKKDKNILKFT